MVEARQRNGTGPHRVPTSVPDPDEWLEFEGRLDARRKERDAQIGGWLRFLGKHWAKFAGVATAAIALWQWGVTQVESKVLAEQSAAKQTEAVGKNTEARTEQAQALTKVKTEVAHANRGVAANQLAQQTTLEVIRAMPQAAAVLRRNKKLRDKVDKALAAEPHSVVAPSPNVGAVGSL